MLGVKALWPADIRAETTRRLVWAGAASRGRGRAGEANLHQARQGLVSCAREASTGFYAED